MFMKEPHTALFVAPTGVGKPHLAWSLLETEYRNHFDFIVIIYHTLRYNSKNDLILIMTPEKQDKTLELSKHWSVDSTPARNEVIMKRTYPVKSVKCDKICSNY